MLSSLNSSYMLSFVEINVRDTEEAEHMDLEKKKEKQLIIYWNNKSED